MLKLPEVRKSAVVANVGRKMRNVVAAVLAAAAIALTPTAASAQTSSDAGNAVTQVSSQSPLLMLQSDFGLEARITTRTALIALTLAIAAILPVGGKGLLRFFYAICVF